MQDRSKFLPTTKKEMDNLGWDCADIILFTGDAYVDHPSFGTAVISRVLESRGYRVAIVPQPNWRDDLRDFKKLGKPRLFFGVTAGAMDSMVNHYTAAKRLRSNDAYTPEGKSNMRPDYAATVYSKILKELFPDTPVVLGGVEASLRRFAHYDYWEDRIFPSILIDSQADYLIYGMGEKPIIDIAEHIDTYQDKQMRDEVEKGIILEGAGLNQIAFYKDFAPTDEIDRVTLHSFEQILNDKKSFAESFNMIETEANRYVGKQIVEQYGDKYIYVTSPYEPLSDIEMDSIYDLPFTRLPHPKYKGKHIPAYEMIKHSITTHRGCFGGCSFCTIAAHQGKQIQSRSEESILKEIKELSEKDTFDGVITDLGAPTANMYGMCGNDKELCKKCYRKSCLYPKMCNNLNPSHRRLLKLYKELDNNKKVKRAYVGSGIRYDLFLNEKGFLDSSSKPYFVELIVNRTSGRLKVAPEHTEKFVLDQMNKPSFALFERLKREFDKVVRDNSLKTSLVPYFISSHPGCKEKDMQMLHENKYLKGVFTDQVQDFTPTPMTKSSVSYYTGLDPKTYTPIFVEKEMNKKKRQKSYFFNK